MRTTANILIGAFSTVLFLALITLVALRFQILNKTFLFQSFERHEVYNQLPNLLADSISTDPQMKLEEKTDFQEFVRNISPQILKPVVEDNLSQVIDYVNGESKNILITFSLNGLGFENASGLRWSLSELPDKNLQEKIKSVNGLGNIMIVILLVIIALLILLVFQGGRVIILYGAIFIIALALITKIYIGSFANDLIREPELIQKVTGLLSISIFTDIANTWFLIGGLLLLIWLSSKLLGMIKRKKAIIQEMTSSTT